MKRLVNYWRMTEKNKATFKKQYESRTAKWTEDSIPANFRIPTELISFRNGTTRYYAFYNVKYKMGIGYVPSDLVALYEQEAWRAYKKYGVDAPSLSIVLAQQFTESAFNPYITGDQGEVSACRSCSARRPVCSTKPTARRGGTTSPSSATASIIF